MKHSTTMLLLLLLSQVPILAQVTQERTVMASAGDQSSSGSLSLNWTLGEPMADTYNASGLSVSQGFHQGGLNATGTHDARLPYEVEVFPNPTSITLFVTAATNQPLRAELIGLDGRLLLVQQLDYPVVKSAIPMADYPAATYFLVLKNENGLSTSFKIQKQ